MAGTSAREKTGTDRHSKPVFCYEAQEYSPFALTSICRSDRRAPVKATSTTRSHVTGSEE